MNVKFSAEREYICLMKSKILNLSFFADVYMLCKKGNVSSLSASLAYYMLFSVFPTFAVLKEIFDSFPQIVPVYESLLENLPSDVSRMISDFFDLVKRPANTGLVTGGVLLSLFSFVRFIRTLKLHLEKIYKTKNRHTYIGSWLFSCLMALYVLALLYLALFTIVFGEQTLKLLVGFLGAEEFFVVFWDKVRILLFVFLLTLFLFLIFCFLPGRTQGIKQTLPGVIFTSVGWILASFLFSVYVNNFSRYSAIYGTLGAFILLMSWLYILCLVILIGANINLAFLKRGS